MQSPINSKTINLINSYLMNPAQAVGLIGDKWLNKDQVAEYLAEKLLGLKEATLATYPYVLAINGDNLSSIGIDSIRQINEFLILKVPNPKPINRMIIIYGADKLTLEAQNALLKNLEEPPYKTIFILSFETVNSLLPTIISRLHIIRVIPPTTKELTAYYRTLGYSEEKISQALLIAGRLPKLVDQLLSPNGSDILKALESARQLLSSTTLERLGLINNLSKDKAQLNNLFFIIKQMAKVGIKSQDLNSAKRWQKILTATLESENALKANVQTKLLLTNYILKLS